MNFNPHSREGSDADDVLVKVVYQKISIHTPAKGVTIPILQKTFRLGISIHTPAKGVTLGGRREDKP